MGQDMDLAEVLETGKCERRKRAGTEGQKKGRAFCAGAQDDSGFDNGINKL